MPLMIDGTSIERVVVFDDNPAAREAYTYPLEELHVEPIPVEGPLESVDQVAELLPTRAGAVLCDYHLTKKNYAAFNGEEIIVRCYEKKIPAVLCTRYTDTDRLRRHRRSIPVLMRLGDLSPETIVSGFRSCIMEFGGDFQPDRRPWRTLVRVEEVVEEGPTKSVYVVLPGWDPNKVVRLGLEDLPANIQPLAKVGKRFHAQVNVGADRDDELYFVEWETQ